MTKISLKSDQNHEHILNWQSRLKEIYWNLCPVLWFLNVNKPREHKQTARESARALLPLNSNLETKSCNQNVNKLKVSFLLSQCPIISIKNLNDVECANQIDEELNNLNHCADSKFSLTKKETKWRIKN